MRRDAAWTFRAAVSGGRKLAQRNLAMDRRPTHPLFRASGAEPRDPHAASGLDVLTQLNRLLFYQKYQDIAPDDVLKYQSTNVGARALTRSGAARSSRRTRRSSSASRARSRTTSRTSSAS